MGTSAPPPFATRELRDAAARMFGIEPYLLCGRSRKQEIVRARHAAIWAMHRRWPQLSYPQIGKRFGGRDHSTIIEAVKRMEYRRSRCDDLRRVTDLLVEMPLGEPFLVPQDLIDRLEALSTEAEARRRKPVDEFARLQREINAEIASYPTPLPSRLNLGLAGEAGDPLRGAAAIEARREEVLRERRARELGLLEAERRKYGLPVRAKPL